MQEEEEEENDTIVDLDDSWITEFENAVDEYNHYDVEDIYYIKVFCIYLHNTEIIKIKKETIHLQNMNHLSRKEFVDIIKQNTFENNIKYSLLNVLKYNIDLQPLHLKTFLKKKNSNQNCYISSLSHIQDITFNASISMFHNLNSLYLIFQQREQEQEPNRTDTPIKATSTKKVYIGSYKNKTIRKPFKEK